MGALIVGAGAGSPVLRCLAGGALQSPGAYRQPIRARAPRSPKAPPHQQRPSVHVRMMWHTSTAHTATWTQHTRTRHTATRTPTRHTENKDSDAARVRALITRLGMTQKQVAMACGVSSGNLGKWLRGIDTHQPAMFEAGAAAMRWHEATKDRPTPPQL